MNKGFKVKMKMTKGQAKWMEGAMLFTSLHVSAQVLNEIVEELNVEDIDLAYKSFMHILESHSTKLKEQLEIVEDNK